MMKMISITTKFLYSFKNELKTKYAIYDNTIQQFSRVGNKISTDLIKNFILNANPKISRQQNYMPKVSHLLKSIIPHFKTHLNFYLYQGLFSSILIAYKTMNIHRKEIFDLVQQNSQQFKKGSTTYWFQIYSSLVDLHHQSNGYFKTKLKNFLFFELCNENFKQGHSSKFDHFQITVKTLKFMLMDQQFDLQQCQDMLKFIEQKIIPKMANISLIDRNIGLNLAFLNELITFQNIVVTSQKFKRVLQEAKKFQMSQKMQSQKSFVKKQNYNISLNEKEESLKSQGSSVSQNTSVINHGQSSVFETIFTRILEQKGYDFKRNVFIGTFQYDVVIEGRNKKIYHPFQNIKEKEFKPISAQEWQEFKSMEDFKKIKINQKFDNPVVLNLNGPYHYIDSDVYGNERVTRTDQMKGMFLKNYGFHNFNTVHHEKWEEVHEKGVYVENYIENLLSQSLLHKI